MARWRQEQVIRRQVAGERGNVFRQGGPRVALLYPSPYRAGMSSLGFQWVLALLRRQGFSAERAFLPETIRGQDRVGALVTHETLTPVSRFPVIGVSLAYELELAGLIQALDLAGIPALASERGPRDPRIVLGGR